MPAIYNEIINLTSRNMQSKMQYACAGPDISLALAPRQRGRKAVKNGSIPKSAYSHAIRRNNEAPLPSRTWKDVPIKFTDWISNWLYPNTTLKQQALLAEQYKSLHNHYSLQLTWWLFKWISIIEFFFFIIPGQNSKES